MFNRLFSRSDALNRQLSAPLADERRHYLANCEEQGMGHVSLNTTNAYAEVDMEMKAKALATCEVRGTLAKTHWKNDVKLMEFLRNL